jgi:hypothetical protein
MRNCSWLVVIAVCACGGSKPAPAIEVPANSTEVEDCSAAPGAIVRAKVKKTVDVVLQFDPGGEMTLSKGFLT